MPIHPLTRGSAPHFLDVWLPRFSNLAQVVLLLLTAGSLYFTVLPLYQKALLDEAIAKKEVELKAASAVLESKYVQIRRFTMREYIQVTGPDCMDMLRKIPQSPNEARAPDITLTLDIKQCLLKHESETRSLSELRPADREFLRQHLSLLGEKLSKYQTDARLAVEQAEQDVNSDNIDELASKRVFASRLNGILSKIASPQQIADFKRRSAVDELKWQRTEKYRNSVSAELFGLLKLNWPPPKQ